ncbi:MAG TPA: DUF805 domain-containing protein [Caulobacteraceae bacterium]|nr:DUF805 domain-containing protein [Caulobacteraceae bacterium]
MTCLRKYVDFNGRAGKAEFWWFVLFYVVVYVVVAIIGGLIHVPALAGLVVLGLFLPNLAVAVRRLHDTNRSGWMYLIGLIPLVGFILLIVWWVGDGTVGDNQYGPDPRGGAGAPTAVAS